MKILMISTDRLIFTTGSEVRRRMLDYGELFEELHVIVFSQKSLGHKKEQLTDNVFVYPTNSRSRLFYLWGSIQIGQVLLSAKGKWIISSQDPFETGLVAWWLKRKFKLKWQAQIHTDFLSSFFASESWLNWLRVKMARFLLPHADKIRVVSLRLKNSIMAWPLKTEPVVLPIFIIPSAQKVCDPNLDLHQKYPQFSFIILMASRLTREKNFPLAFGAFAVACLDRPNVGLIIVGQGPEKKHLQDLTRTFRAGSQIIFEDWQCDLSCYYQSADLFLLTSDYEGYGRTLVEAGLSGCPVLTTDVGLVGELANEQNSLICPVGDEECLAEKISWAIANHGPLKILGVNFQNKLKFSVLHKKAYLKIYQQNLLD